MASKANNPRKPLIELICKACGEMHQSTRAKATRCRTCIDAGIKAPVEYKPRRTCLECRKTFTLTEEDHVNCAPCAEFLHIEQHEVTPEQQAFRDELDRQEAFRSAAKMIDERLTERCKKPTGMKLMTKPDRNQPISELWLRICIFDGAAAALKTPEVNTGLSDDDLTHLMVAYQRLRLRGYHPDAIAKLCPKALLMNEPQVLLEALPIIAAAETGVSDQPGRSAAAGRSEELALAAMQLGITPQPPHPEPQHR